jgi:serine/threonine-protein kinase
MDTENWLGDIPHYSSWVKIHPITKGFSMDKKYFIENDVGQKMLLRISDITHYQSTQQYFEEIKNIATLGFNMSRPLDFGMCANKTCVYSLFTWVEGKDASSILPNLSESRQYEHGITAGNILRKIHTLPAPLKQKSWEVRFEQKIQQKLKNYANCNEKLERDTEIIQFMHENRSYLANRPQVLHHGDFHPGNLIISRDDELGVIDFNRMEFGDPWEEFTRVVFSRRVSLPFTLGQIHGYFNNEVPDLFFRLMVLYIATNTISSIPWAVPYGEEEVDFMRTMADEVLQYYDGFKTYIPRWYQDPK